jgi:hypothetical protein
MAYSKVNKCKSWQERQGLDALVKYERNTPKNKEREQEFGNPSLQRRESLL